MSDEALVTCPVCAGGLRRVYDSVGVAFKGSGFYRTDSRPRKKPDSKPTPPASSPTTGGA